MGLRIWNLFRRNGALTVEQLREKLGFFRDLVERNDRVLRLMAEAGEKLGGEYVFGDKYLQDLASGLKEEVHGVVTDLNAIAGNRYPELLGTLGSIDARVQASLELRMVIPEAPIVLPLDQVGMEDLEIVGEKMARLGEVKTHLGLAVPDGWVVSTHACREFLSSAGLLQAAEDLLARVEDGEQNLDGQARALQEKIRKASLPRKMSRLLEREANRLRRLSGLDLFAVRSSAPGEDDHGGWAGQFATVLGVGPDSLVDAYRTVVASLVSPSALAARRTDDTPFDAGNMAVGVMALIPARASGVVYSLDPMNPRSNLQVISGTWGLGKGVVEGDIPTDRFEVAREPGFPVRSRTVARKDKHYSAVPEHGTSLVEVPTKRRDKACLTDEDVSKLADAACRIERYMRCAQDIEWCQDEAGQLYILQARPLTLVPEFLPQERDLSGIVGSYPVLMSGNGEVACRGIGSGPVLHVPDPSEPSADTARGKVLVARTASPRLGRAIGGAAAVITETGSSTGHLAAVARQLRIPTILGMADAFSAFEDDQTVTVDAEENVVYEGVVPELLQYQLLRSSSFQDSREFRVLRRLLRQVSPLHLNDPNSPDFTPTKCTTYHDVIRFAHEKAVDALTDLGGVAHSSGSGQIQRLRLPIPLDLVVIDLGGGLSGEGSHGATLSDLTCRPLLPLLSVLAGEGGWETAPADMDLDGFMASATRSAPLMNPGASRPEQNLAIISQEYLHLSLKLGYHFNVVDASLTARPGDNYIYFRFAGGVTELTRRSRRATVLKIILEHHGFVVEGSGDLVIARLRGSSAAAMEKKMEMVGRLIGFTRQLDIFLKSDGLVEEYADRFLKSDSP